MTITTTTPGTAHITLEQIDAITDAIVKKSATKVDKVEGTVDNNVTITLASETGSRWNSSGNSCNEPYTDVNGFAETRFRNLQTDSSNKNAKLSGIQDIYRKIIVAKDTTCIHISGGCSVISIGYNSTGTTGDSLSVSSFTQSGFTTFTEKRGYTGSPYSTQKGHIDFEATIAGDFKAGDVKYVTISFSFYNTLTNFDKSKFGRNLDCVTIASLLNQVGFTPSTSCRSAKIQMDWNISYD